MAEITGPDGNKYYSEDHFTSDKKSGSNSPSFTMDSLTDRVYLIGGGVAILIGLWLLADIAIGLILLFLGSTGVNYWMMRKGK